MEINVYRLVISVHLNVTSTDYFTVTIQSSSSAALGLMMMTDKRSISSLLKSFTGVCSDTPAPAETHIQMRDLDIFSVEIPSSVLHKSWRNEISLDLPPSDRQADSFSAELAYLYWNIFCITLYFAFIIKLDPVSSRWHEISVRKLIS